MKDLRVREILDDLDSDSYERHFAGLEKAEQVINALATSAVEALRRGPMRLAIAERLAYLGSAVVPPLERLMDEADDPETKLHAGLVLLQLGSSKGVPWLLEALSTDDADSCLIARSLARAGVQEVVDKIWTRLLPCTIERIGLIDCLLTVLDSLDAPPLPELRSEMASSIMGYLRSSDLLQRAVESDNDESRKAWTDTTTSLAVLIDLGGQIPSDLRSELAGSNKLRSLLSVFVNKSRFLTHSS